MRRLFLVSLIVVLTGFIGACGDRANEQKAGSSLQGSNTGNVVTGLAGELRKQKLANFDAKTIGEAFDSYRYLTNKEWKERLLPSKTIEITFIGWFPQEASDGKTPEDGVLARGLEVKFDITRNGQYYAKMISRLEAKSGSQINAYQLNDITAILAKIYADKEISF